MKEFEWLSPEHTAALGARIVASPGARLEWRTTLVGGKRFRVVTPGAIHTDDDPTDINDSKICPPICP